MSIEDIDFLKNNSIKENYIFLVDSKDRDRSTYPDPSNYVVEFDTPFRNVIGLNLIDASIPRTMYNIDAYNNSISFYIYSTTIIGDEPTPVFKEVFLTCGDYSIQSLIVELDKSLNMHLNNDPTAPLISIAASPTTNPPDIQSRIQFTCPFQFMFDMKNSTIAESLGFDGYIRQSEVVKEVSVRNYEAPVSTNSKIYGSVYIPYTVIQNDSTLLTANTYTLFEGPKGVIRTLSLQNKKVCQRFYVPFETNLVKIYAALQTTELTASSGAHFTLQSDVNGFPEGSHPLATGVIAVSFIDGSYSDSSVLNYKFEGNKYYWVVFENNTTNTNIYYNDQIATETTLAIYDSIWSTPDITDEIYYQLSIRINVCNEYHCLKSTGIYSLIGERYITLKCKEIEENSFRSLAYTKHSLGIAKFTLGVVGYKEERLDYSSVPSREFHPIGKLSRLTLRFETASGKLYDFKDVNHTLTFAIKYLEPHGRVDFKKSIINSNYNGDFIKYKYGQEEQEEDSDDQDIDYNRDEFEKYKNNEARNLPIQVAQRNIKMFYDINNPLEENQEEPESDS